MNHRIFERKWRFWSCQEHVCLSVGFLQTNRGSRRGVGIGHGAQFSIDKYNSNIDLLVESGRLVVPKFEVQKRINARSTTIDSNEGQKILFVYTTSLVDPVVDRAYSIFLRIIIINILTSDQARLPAEFKHITKRRKRN